MGRVWVVNASPLILLGSIGRIDLLPRLCGELIIPGGVADEVENGPASDPARIWVQEHGRPFVRPVDAVVPIVAAWDLGLGESQVLSLCHGEPEREAILDDRPARRCAAGLAIPVRGTLAVIVLARQEGLIPLARPLFVELLSRGLRATPGVVDRAIRLAGE